MERARTPRTDAVEEAAARMRRFRKEMESEVNHLKSELEKRTAEAKAHEEAKLAVQERYAELLIQFTDEPSGKYAKLG